MKFSLTRRNSSGGFLAKLMTRLSQSEPSRGVLATSEAKSDEKHSHRCMCEKKDEEGTTLEERNKLILSVVKQHVDLLMFTSLVGPFGSQVNLYKKVFCEKEALFCAFSPDGKSLAWGSRGAWGLLEVAGEKLRRKTLEFPREKASHYALSPGGRFYAMCSRGTVILWDNLRQKSVKLLDEEESICEMDFPCRDSFAVCSAKGEVMTWSLRELKLKTKASLGPICRIFDDHLAMRRCVFFSGGELMCGLLRSLRQPFINFLAIWNVSSGELEGFNSNNSEIEEYVLYAISPGGGMLASSMEKGKVTLWNIRTKKMMAELCLSDVHSASFSPRGDILALGCRNGEVFLWALPTDPRPTERALRERSLWGEKDLRKLGSSTGMRLAWSPRGTFLAACGDSRKLTFWELSSGRRAVAKLRSLVKRCCFSPCEKRLACYSEDGMMRLLDVEYLLSIAP